MFTMKNFRSIPGLLIALLFLTVTAYAQNDTTAIRDCFMGYKVAILNDEGKEAIRYIDSRTIRYYTQMLSLTRSADSTTVAGLSFLDKLMVLSVRHRTTKAELKPMNGEDLLVYAINHGMVGKNGVVQNDLGAITIDESFATGQLIHNGQPTPLKFHFYKEQEQWKLNLTALFPMAEAAMQHMLAESGESENDYLLTLLEMTTGKKPAPSVWHPVE
jgi:hypothetical protein